MRKLVFVVLVLVLLGSPAVVSAQGPLEIRFDLSVPGETGSDLRTKRGGLRYAYVGEQLRLLLENADWESEYVVVYDSEELAVARPVGFGETITVGSVSGIGDLFRTGAESTIEAFGAAGDRVLFTRRSFIDNHLNARYLRDLELDLDNVLARLGSLLDRLVAADREVASVNESLVDLADTLGANGSARARIAEADSYPAHRANVSVLRVQAQRLDFAHLRMVAAIGVGSEIVTDKAVIDLIERAAELLAEIEQLEILVQELSTPEETRNGGAPERDCAPGDVLCDFRSLLAGAVTGNGDRARNRLADRLESVRERVDSIRMGIESALRASAAAEIELRALVDLFNGRYAVAGDDWEPREPIEVDLPMETEQARARVEIYRMARPLRVTLEFDRSRTARGDAVQSRTTTSGPAPGPATPIDDDPPKEGTLLAATTFDVHQRYDFRFSAGFVRSSVDDVEYRLRTVTLNETGEDGEAFAITRERIVELRDSHRVLPVFLVHWHVLHGGKDLNRDTYTGSRRLIPSVVVGFSLSEPAKSLLAGLSIEPFAGLDIVAGRHWHKQPTLVDGAPGDLLPEGSELLAQERFVSDWFLGLTLDVGVFEDIFSGLF